MRLLTNISRISDPGVGSSSEHTTLVELVLGRVGVRDCTGVGSGSTVRAE